jgi:RyR domain
MNHIEIEKIARICHNVNKAYCESIGDRSQPTWEDAPEWQKDSAVSGVKLHLSGDDVKPHEAHANWLAQKVMDGWVYGEVKDSIKKTHPCMVPYHELSVEQRTKDYLFKAVVDSHKEDN